MKYGCLLCRYVYDPVIGNPDAGVPPGTAFENLPEGWGCPICGAGSEFFKTRD